MIERNTKLYKILFIIGCVVLAIAFSFGLKTMIDYKNNEYSEAGKYGEISEEGGGSSGSSTVVPTVTISGSSSIYVGKTTTLTATVSDGSAVSWSTSDTSIASVSTSGVVTGKMQGSVTIYARTTNGGEGSKTITVSNPPCSDGYWRGQNGCEACPIGYACDGISKSACSGTNEYQDETGKNVCKQCNGTVNSDHTSCVSSVVELNRLEFSPSTISLSAGSSKTFAVKAYYTDGTSKDVTSLATISGFNADVSNPAQGYVKGNNAGGSATIKATYAEGDIEKEATCNVTVTGAVLNSLVFSPSSINLNVNGSEKFIVKAYYTDGTSKDVTALATISGFNADVSNPAQGYVKGNNAGGSATIKATYAEGDIEKEATCNVTVSNVVKQIAGTPSSIHLARSSDSMTINVNVYDSDSGEKIENLELSATSKNGYVDVSTSLDNYSGDYYPIYIESNGRGGGEGSSTVTDVVTVCVKNESPSVCTSITVYLYCSPWTVYNITKTFNTGWLLSNAHVTSGRCEYMDPNDCTRNEAEDGTVTYTCSKYYNRCCGTGGGGTTPSTEDDACYMNNATGIYVWGKYKNDSNYTLIADKTSSDTCKPSPEGGEGGEVYACYKDANNNYKWATTAPEGYTLVESIKDEENCKVVDKAACYIDTNNKYVWGDYSNNASYKLVESIKTAENCVNPPACYKDKDGNFVWGNYAYNSSYSLIANITSQSDCGESVKVPSTAASTATIIYISVIVMLIAGGSVVYYVYNKKKFS